MFTGLVTAVGCIRAVHRDADGLELVIESPYEGLELGESVAVDGACLTVAGLEEGAFRVHVVQSSLDRTRFGDAAEGQRVNLERALRLGDRLGGHLVQGHVEGVGQVRRVGRRDDAVLLDLQVPPDVALIAVPLGSITVDGVSLTVNARPGPDTIQISLIPHTLQHTTLGDLVPGDRVHLEGDMIGRYVQAILHQRQEDK